MSDLTFQVRLGRVIHMHRVMIGMGRRELATRARISYPYLSGIENGKKFPTIATLANIATALHTDLSTLLNRVEEGTFPNAE